jgi:uncharacterized protein YaaR (DUF327 family)
MKKPILSRPKDKSLEAYKAWIKEFVKSLGGSSEDDMTEEQWVEGWKKFWSKVNGIQS